MLAEDSPNILNSFTRDMQDDWAWCRLTEEKQTMEVSKRITLETMETEKKISNQLSELGFELDQDMSLDDILI